MTLAVRVLVSLCLPAVAFAASDDLIRRLHDLSCENYLTGTPPEAPGPRPTARTGWQTFGSALILDLDTVVADVRTRARLKRHDESVAAHAAAVEKLGVARVQAARAWRAEERRALGEGLDPRFRGAANLLSAKAKEMITNARTKDQLELISAVLVTHADEIRAESDELTRAERAQAESLTRARRARELRFDVGDRRNVSEIAAAFVALVPKDTPPPADLTERMTADARLKSFVILEIQQLRRLALVANGGADVAALRIANDLRALATANDVPRLSRLRRELVRLNAPAVLRDLAPDGGLRVLDALAREEIIADALSHDELELTILNAALDLAPIPDAPVAPPPFLEKQPSPTRATSRREYDLQMRDYNAWRASNEAHAAALTRFRETSTRRQYLLEAHDRRARTRRSFVAYLAYRRPSLFASPEIARARADESRAVTAPRIEATARSVSRSTSSPTNDVDSMLPWWIYWQIFWQNEHPYYVDHPHRATEAYAWDSVACTNGGDMSAATPLPLDARVEMHQLNQQTTPDGAAPFDLPPPPDVPPPPDLGGPAAPDAPMRTFDPPPAPELPPSPPDPPAAPTSIDVTPTFDAPISSPVDTNF